MSSGRAFSSRLARLRPSAPGVMAWVVYIFLMTPTLIVIPMSFGKGTELMFPPQEWGIDLYRKMLDPSEGWIAAAGRSLTIAVLATLFSTVIGTCAGYGLVRGKFRGRKLVGFLLLSPIFAPTIVIALALYLYFAHLGISGTFFGLVIGHTLIVAPFVIITTMSGLKHIDENVEIAASVMGADRIQIFWKVVLPQIRPAILSGALFAFLLSFDEVVVSFFVSASQTPTLPVKMYSSIQWEISPVLAAISAVLILITSIIAIIAAVIQPSDGIQR